MASDVQSALLQLQSDNYVSLAMVIAVGYDYCLTFSQEVTYVWRQPWTKVSTLFLFIRYGGLVSALRQYFRAWPSDGKVTYLLANWTFPFFLAGADMGMILRVYAMFDQSRMVLGVLLALYIAEVTMLVVSTSVYSVPKYAAAYTVNLLDITVCGFDFIIDTWNIVATIFQLMLSTALCILVIVRLVMHIELRQQMQGWQLNSYLRLLIREGFLYFLATLFSSLIIMLDGLRAIPTSPALVSPVLSFFAYVPVYTLIPRFIINIRKLYALDGLGRWERVIDSGFGLSSGVEVTSMIGTIAFAESGDEGGLDNGEVMP